MLCAEVRVGGERGESRLEGSDTKLVSVLGLGCRLRGRVEMRRNASAPFRTKAGEVVIVEDHGAACEQEATDHVRHLVPRGELWLETTEECLV